jgi:hypothetical protein
VIGHCPLETQAAEPPVRQIEVDLLAQPTLGPDAEAVTDEEPFRFVLPIRLKRRGVEAKLVMKAAGSRMAVAGQKAHHPVRGRPSLDR